MSAAIKKEWLLILPYALTNIEIQRHYQNESIFKGFYSQDNLPKIIKDGVYKVNLCKHNSIETHWLAFCMWIIIEQYTLIALEWNAFNKKLNYLLKTKVLY